MEDVIKLITWFVKDRNFTPTLLNFSLLLLSCILIFPVIYVIPLLMGYVIEVIKTVRLKRYMLPEISPTTQWQPGLLFLLVLLGVGTVSTVVLTICEQLCEPWGALGELFIAAGVGFTNIVISFMSVVWAIIFAQRHSLSDIVNMQLLIAIVTLRWRSIILSMILVFLVTIVCLSVGLVVFCIGILPALVMVLIITGSLYGSVDISFFDQVISTTGDDQTPKLPKQ